MITMSLCMIVRNEEASLRRCLGPIASIFDEIIIVDTGSCDHTKEIAREFTDIVFDFNWADNFSDARNFAFEKATMEYIMWLDADDVILPGDIAKLSELKETLSPTIDAVMMRYNTGFDEFGNVTFSFFRERLVKRNRGFKWREPVHEYIEMWGKIINSDVAITHSKSNEKESMDSGRNIRIYERLLEDGKTLTARGVYYYARELKDHGRYLDAIKWFNDFLDTGKGWVEDNIAACIELANCLRSVGNPCEALLALFRSFSYDSPRGEACCQIGYRFMELSNYRLAIFWFELALNLKRPDEKWGFIKNDCWGYIPCIELAVCYDKLGNLDEAERYNEMAAQYKPDSLNVLHNKGYFKKAREI